MKRPDREELLGYLIGALEPAEQRRIEAALEAHPELSEELGEVSRQLFALDELPPPTAPPTGLARRTCEAIAALDPTPARKFTATDRLQTRSTWSASELGVAAAACLVIALIFFPAIANSRHQARIMTCQNNMRQIGIGLESYSEAYDGDFVPIARSGNLSVAGIFGPRLLDMDLLASPAFLLCPSSPQVAERESFTLPSCDEIENLKGAELHQVRLKMGGSYAYSLGYFKDGVYYAPRRTGHGQYVILTDAPHRSGGDRMSANHGRHGQNVMYEDQSIRYVVGCSSTPDGDSFFENRLGLVAAGVDPFDSVVGRSEEAPNPDRAYRP